MLTIMKSLMMRFVMPAVREDKNGYNNPTILRLLDCCYEHLNQAEGFILGFWGVVSDYCFL